jgi:hypothetical protein
VNRWIFAGLAEAAAMTGWALGRGDHAMTGFLLGTAATTVDLVGLWGAIRLFGRPAATDSSAKLLSVLIVLVFFMKLPIFFFLANISHHLGAASDKGFLLGIGLVYSLLVGGVLATSVRAQ